MILIINCGSRKTKNIYHHIVKQGLQAEVYFLYKKGLVEHEELDVFDLSLIVKRMALIKQEGRALKTRYELNSHWLSTFDAIILSGGGKLSGLAQEYICFFEELKTVKVPVLGICFGHQMLGLIHGAEIHNMKEKDKGWRSINLKKEATLFAGFRETVKFRQNHSEYITVPPSFEVAGVSDACNNEAMQHKNKPMFGVQFHPEVSGKNGDVFFSNFCRLVSAGNF